MPELAEGNADNHAALTALQAITEPYGAQSELARRCGLPRLHMRTIITGERRPSADVAAAIEREVGVPASWWALRRPRRMALPVRDVASGRAQAAREELAVRKAASLYPLHHRLRIDPEALEGLLNGTLAPDSALQSVVFEVCGIPCEWWNL